MPVASPNSAVRWTSLSLAAFLCLCLSLLLPAIASAQKKVSEQPVARKGVFMGLDPGVAMRFNDFGKPVFARLTLRIGGCINRRIQLGADWRMDIWAGGDRVAQQNTHEIGPVATFFLVRGWFARVYTHIGAIDPFTLTNGSATGYEWSMGRFSGGGILIGGDSNIRFDGHAPDAYSIFASFYLTAYDLGTRRGRNEF
ncbi:MAG: hypothetical protein JXX14_02265 [Deltaproteobacteria bacterium]|nr:hypothetical protein [Deltaproteobacteria bacterium]